MKKKAASRVGTAHHGKFVTRIGDESETEAWSRVHEMAARLEVLGKLGEKFGDGSIGRETAALARIMKDTANRMFDQVRSGVHKNPPKIADAFASIALVGREIAALPEAKSPKVQSRVKYIIGVADKGYDARARKNPPLTVLSLMNPPKGGKQISKRLYTIEYQHAGNGKNYFHDFHTGTQMYAMPDGSIRISRPGGKVWGDFDAE